MKRLNLLLAATFILITSLLQAQNGTVRGTVIDDELGDEMIGVTVMIKGTTKGSVTDFDGKFNISIAPGIYNLKVSFVSFETLEISDIEVKAGETVIFDPIRLKESVEELEAVVVTADVIKSSEAALLTVKKKSANMIDGISASSFKKIGDSNAAGAVKRVTGVSVEGGKYVYVRGLGDRYTKTTLNNVDIPGLDPDRNSLQIDIFPTNMLNNMVISKTATADQPADFTGGLVNIETKDFPEQKILDVSVGITYNPSMHFKNEALTYEGSSTDWLGFDSDLRELPKRADNQDLPFINEPDAARVVSDQFSKTLAASEETNFMNYNLGISVGNQKNFDNGNSLGYIFTGTYKRDNEYFEEVTYGEYQKQDEPTAYDFGIQSISTGSYSTENTLLGGLVGIAYKTSTAKYKFSVMHLQNGEKRTAELYTISDSQDDDFDPRLISDYTSISNNLEYSERGLTNILLRGEHHINGNQWVIDWKFSPTISKLADPDIRRASFSNDTDDFLINPGAAGVPTRIWRFLDEVDYVGRVDITNEGSFLGAEAKYKFGGSYVTKDREYSIQNLFVQQTSARTDWSGDFNEILSDDRLFPTGTMYYQNGPVNPNPNSYISDSRNISAYVSGEINPFTTLKTIVGLRMEAFQQHHTGRDQQSTIVLDDSLVLDAVNFFPSLNNIYSLTDNMNLRLSFYRTIARPSFKELSFASILDPVSNRTFNGGFFPYNDDEGNVVWDGNLRSTLINNFDLRWEFFQKRGELFSVSLFYKRFEAPIELVRIAASQTGNEFQPRNVGDGRILGAEFEFRKSLQFIHSSLSDFSVYGNVTIVDSQIEMTDQEFNARAVYEKEGETIDNTRDMAGQAPYVINFGLQYNNAKKGIDAGLFYNVKGETLTVVGIGFFPDIYSQPFHSLNFNLNKTFGAKDQISANFSVSNILNDNREEFFVGFEANNEIFNQLTPGTEIGLGVSYSF